MNKEERQKRLEFLTVCLIVYLLSTLVLCQLLIFWKSWDKFALSILLGTCGVMVGGFSAFLASPYGSNDKERLSRVGSTISTLITGYILAKIIDPIIAVFTDKERIPVLFALENGANVLIAIIGFLAGFLFVYQYRVYISGEISENESIKKQALLGLEKIVNDENEEIHSREEALISIVKIDEKRGEEIAAIHKDDPALEKISNDILSK